jgi:hypothetical protein
MGQTDPENASAHNRQSMILVPMDTPGVKLVLIWLSAEGPPGSAITWTKPQTPPMTKAPTLAPIAMNFSMN